jgi:hypothetical protein
MYDHRQVEKNLLVSQAKNYPGMVRLHHSFELAPWDGVVSDAPREGAQGAAPPVGPLLTGAARARRRRPVHALRKAR